MTQRIGLSGRGHKLLSHLRTARDRSSLDEFGLDPQLVEDMLRSGLLEGRSETMPLVDYQNNCEGWRSQRGMLIDHARTLAFQNAIAAVVQPGDRVIDVGTGSGILAMMAAREGAAESWGLEVTEMADWASRIAQQNALPAVRIVRGDAAAFTADQPADVIMGEFAGMYLLDEWRHFAAFAQLRDRHLREGGAVIPRAARLYLSAIDSRKLYHERGYGFWEAPVYGFDFSAVRATEIAAPRRYIVSADHNAIVSCQQIAAIDFLTGTEHDYFFTAEASFDYPAAGMFHGLIGHFELDMAPGQVLATGTADRETHWHQSYFPLPAVPVPASGRIAVRVRSFLSPDDVLCVGMTVAGPDAALDDGADHPEHVFTLE